VPDDHDPPDDEAQPREDGPGAPAPHAAVAEPGPASALAVRPAPGPAAPGPAPAVVWRERALAVRAGLPQLARHPAVVGASAAAAAVAARVAVEVVRRALVGPAPARSGALVVTGHVVHHVVHHVVVTRVPGPVVVRQPLEGPRD
jgi:hypothetical protein